MKKGLRQRRDYLQCIARDSDRRPDEEGIKTYIASCIDTLTDSNRRPDEEGIKTDDPDSGFGTAEIPTADLMKKGLRPTTINTIVISVLFQPQT